MNIFKRMELAWKHRGQPAIQRQQGNTQSSAPNRFYFERSYDNLEVVRRGTDMIVDSASEVDINITGQLNFPPLHDNGRARIKTLFTTLNFRPNPDEGVSEFRRQLVMDLVLTGNCYQYWDDRDLFHLPSSLIEVVSGSDKKISHYLYDGKTKFYPSEIIHTRDNAAKSIYVGRSRLYCTKRTIDILQSMLDFQESFFENGAVPGLVIQTPNILGAKIKNKMLEDWKRRYKPNEGGKSPIILDGDLKVNPLSQVKFTELDFESSIVSHENKILKALGVPPILLNSGNNANLRPNIQLFYETTVLPLVAKLIGSYERFFAYDMEPEVVKVRSLRPELKEAGQYFTGLVNGGIMTPNEARAELRLEPIKDKEADELRIPQNIAGSAVDPNEGGKPPADEGEEPPADEGKDD